MKRIMSLLTAALMTMLTAAETLSDAAFQEPVLTVHAEGDDAMFDETEGNEDIAASGRFGAEGDNLEWTLDEDDILHISGNGKMENWYFTDMNGSQADGWNNGTPPWISYLSRIQSVTVEDGVTEIGSNAFRGLTQCKEISLPDSVTKINLNAFARCTALTELKLPASLEQIPDTYGLMTGSLVYGCTALEEIWFLGKDCVFPENPYALLIQREEDEKIYPNLEVLSGSTAMEYAEQYSLPFTIFDSDAGVPADSSQIVSAGKCGVPGTNVFWTVYSDGLLVFSGEGAVREYDVWDEETPWQHLSVKKAVFSEGITSFYPWILDNCGALTEITLPSTFDYQRTLRSEPNEFYYASWPRSIERIHISEDHPLFCDQDGVLYTKDMTKIVCVPPNYPANAFSFPESVVKIGDFAFADCLQLKTITLPDRISEIGSFAFRTCGLNSILIPGNVTKIGKYAFSGCELVSAELEEGIETIPEGLFSVSGDNIKLETVILPDSLKHIGTYAFGGCASLSELTIPSSVQTIGSCAFVGCTSLEEITIPDGVTVISDGLFSECSNLVSVSLPDSVTEIRNSAFFHCISLKTIDLPDQITSIGGSCFYSCTGLRAVTLPAGLQQIQAYAFEYCENLASFEIADTNAVFSTVNGVLFDKKTGTLLLYPPAKLSDSYRIPNGCVSIAPRAFAGCQNLKTLSLHDGITELGEEALAWCDSMETIVLPSSLRKIGKLAFWCCTSLKEIQIPETVTELGHGVFEGCRSLTAIELPDTLSSLPEYMCNSCEQLTEINLPSGIEEIPDGAFDGAESLETIEIPESIRRIGSRAFYECKKLQSISIPSNTTEIGDDAFYRCSSLADITFNGLPEQIGGSAFKETMWLSKTASESPLVILNGILIDGSRCTGKVVVPDEVTVIAAQAFSGNREITGISIPDSVIQIGDGAFSSCTELVEAALPASLAELPKNVFYGCAKLKYLSIPKSVSVIDSDAFYGCASLTGIDLQGVITIGENAFRDCIALSEVAVPNLSEIGRYAFEGTEWLNNQRKKHPLVIINTVLVDGKGCIGDIVIPDEVTSIGPGTFECNESITGVTFPDGLSVIGEYAFFGCKALTEITIPKKVTVIPEGAFYGCYYLKTVEFAGTVTEIGAGSFRECGFETVVIPASVQKVDWYAYASIPAKSVTVLNPECDLSDYKGTICTVWAKDGGDAIRFDGVIRGYRNSTAQAYAEMCGYQFEAIDQPQEYTEEFNLNLNPLDYRVYDAKSEIVEKHVSEESVAFPVISADKRKVSIQAANPGYCEIVFQLADGDRYLFRVTVGGSTETTSVSFTESSTTRDSFTESTTASTTVSDTLKTEAQIVVSSPDFDEQPEGVAILYLDKITVPAGQRTVPVSLSIKNNSGYGSLGVQLRVPENTEPEGVKGYSINVFTEGPASYGMAGDSVTVLNYKPDDHFVAVSVFSKSEIRNDGAIVTFNLILPEDAAAGDEYPIIINKVVEFRDSYGELVDYATVNGLIKISETAEIVHSTTTGTTTESQESITTEVVTTASTATVDDLDTTTEAVTTSETTTENSSSTDLTGTTETTTSLTDTTVPVTETTATTTTESYERHTDTTALTESEMVSTETTTSSSVSLRPFDFSSDTWSFANRADYFTDRFTGQRFLLEKDRNRLFANVNPTEWERMQELLENPGGACYGLILLSLMNHAGLISPSDLVAGAELLRDISVDGTIRLDETLRSIITYHHLLQCRDEISSKIDDSLFYTTNEDRISGLLESLDNGQPAMIGYVDVDTHFQHVVLAYDYQAAQVSKKVNGVTRNFDRIVKVYDPASPEDDPDFYIYINRKQSSWYIPVYQMSSDKTGSAIAFVLNDLQMLTRASMFSGESKRPERFYPHMLLASLGNQEYDVKPVFKKNGRWFNEGSHEDEILDGFGFLNGSASDEEQRDLVMKYDNKSYRFRYDPSESDVDDEDYYKADVQMRFQDAIYSFSSKNVSEIVFSHDGMDIQSEHKRYSLYSIRNDAPTNKDFYRIQIDGSNSGGMGFYKSGSGWILSSDDDLMQLDISAESMNGSYGRSVATAARSIYLFAETNGKIGVRLDTDGDGEFETDFSRLKSEDVNNDGQVSVADAVSEIRFLAEDENAIYRKDVDGDGICTLLDAVKILNVLTAG